MTPLIFRASISKANFWVSQCGDRILPSKRGKSRSSSLARPIPRDRRSSCSFTRYARNSDDDCRGQGNRAPSVFGAQSRFGLFKRALNANRLPVWIKVTNPQRRQFASACSRRERQCNNWAQGSPLDPLKDFGGLFESENDNLRGLIPGRVNDPMRILGAARAAILIWPKNLRSVTTI